MLRGRHKSPQPPLTLSHCLCFHNSSLLERPALSWAGFFFCMEPIEVPNSRRKLFSREVPGPRVKVEIWAFMSFLFYLGNIWILEHMLMCKGKPIPLLKTKSWQFQGEVLWGPWRYQIRAFFQTLLLILPKWKLPNFAPSRSPKNEIMAISRKNEIMAISRG